MDTQTKPHTSARDFFLYLGVIVSLYVGSVFWIRLLIDIIDLIFPDPLQYFAPGDSVRTAISSLIVAVPLFFILSHLIVKDLSAHPEKAELWVRRWLTYLTLFLAGVTIAVSLIVVVNRFLGGALTGVFFLKAFAVLAVAALIFSYYIFDLRSGGSPRSSRRKLYAWSVPVLVVVSIVVGIIYVGSPTKQRSIRFDQERIGSLQNIQGQVVYYWQQKSTLPENLNVLENDITGFRLPTDPETGESYSYTVLDPLRFELCATFSMEGDDLYARPIYPDFDTSEGSWAHGAGEQCFERTIDPELLQPVKR